MIFVSCHSDHTTADLKDNNNTAKLSNFFWSSTLTYTHTKKALLVVKLLKEGAFLKTIISEGLNHLPLQGTEKKTP